MRIKLLFSTVFLLLTTQVSFAQFTCGAEITPAQQAQMDAHDAAFQKFIDNGGRATLRNSQTMLFPVKHHIVRKSDGTGGIADADVINQINILNNYFINANIQFYQCGPINYIDDDQYYDFENSEEAALTSANNVQDVINVYYCNSVTGSSGSPVCGYAYFPGGPDVIMMVNSCTPNGVTMLHEMGHYFALYHTHGTSNTGTTDELVDGSNCSTHGDRLCDTPADPNLTGKVDFNCNYTGNDRDANGDLFVPDPSNIMAYSLDQCQNYFSTDQYARMEFTGINSRQYLTCASGPCGISTLDVTNESSWGAADGSIDLTILGTPPFTYLWDNGATTEDISGLSPGTYKVTITDGDGCIQEDSATVGYDGCSPSDVVAFVELTTFSFASDISWEIVRQSDAVVIASGSEYVDGETRVDTVCLTEGENLVFKAYDSNGDGWNGATYKVTCGGKVVLADNNGVSPDNGVIEGSLAIESQEVFSPAPCTSVDVAAIEIVQPISRCDLGNAEQVAVKVKNYSALPLTGFDISVSVDGQPFLTETEPNVTLGFLEEYVYTFQGTIDVQGVGLHTITASATAIGDTNTTNDTTSAVVESEPTAINSFPYIVDFETPSNWVQIQGEDDFDWTLNNGSTPTQNTGPTFDHTRGDNLGDYMYIESSNPNNPFKKAMIQTACIDISSLNSPYLEFYYHMFGQGVEQLEVQVLGNQGWQTIWTKRGSQANDWVEQDLTLNAFVGQVIKIRFIGYTGQSQFGDIAIDDIKIFNNVVPLGGSIISTVEPSCNGGNDGQATAQGTDGVPPYSYAWSNGNAGQSINNLSAGNVSVTITDAVGQSFVANASISEPTPVVAAILTQFDVSCANGNDGNATAQGFGGTSPYTYLWSDGQTTASATSLSAGTHWVKVFDKNGCVDSISVTLTEPSALVASIDSVGDVDCFGASNGFMKASASGGTPPYSFNWASGFTGDSLTGLSAGVYTLQVVDDAGCSFVVLDTVKEPTRVLIALDSMRNVSCFGDTNGFISVGAIGGTAPYVFMWSTGDSAVSSINNLGAGTYSVTATDANGCTGSLSFVVSEPSALGSSTSSNDATCNGCADGSATVNISGGTPPFQVQWSNLDDSTTTTGLSAGTYYVTIQDANLCSITDSVIISEPVAVQASVTTTDVLCTGDSTGGAEVSIIAGTAPYTYLWDTGDSTSSIQGMPAGTYNVTVTDATGSQTTVSGTISEPGTALSVGTSSTQDEFSTQGCEGTATASVGGGTPPYSYQWSDPQQQQTVTAFNLCAGTYTVVVTDANGCKETSTATVSQNVSIEEREALNVIVYPNPARDMVNLSFEQALDADVQLKMINLLGEVVLERTIEKGESLIQISTAKYAEGVYQVWFVQKGSTQVKNLIIQR